MKNKKFLFIPNLSFLLSAVATIIITFIQDLKTIVKTNKLVK